MAAAAFSQPNTPTKVGIGRRDSMPLQTLSLTCADAIAGHLYTITIVGSDGLAHPISYTVPASSSTSSVATAIGSAIGALPNALTVIGTITVTSNTITIARTDGLLTDLKLWSSNFQVNDISPASSIASDLALIYAADPRTWYGLAIDQNSALDVEAAAAWTEANGKIFACNSSDYANCLQGSTTCLGAVLKTGNYAKTYCQQNNKQLLNCAGMGMLGLMLPQNPGSATWMFQQPAGIPVDDDASLSETAMTALLSYNMNFYKNQATPFTVGGMSPSGAFIDIAWGLDWLKANLQIDIIQKLVSLPKLPMTNFGIGEIYDVIKARLVQASTKEYQLFDNTPTRPIVVTVPDVSAILPADRAARNLTGVSASAYLAGAIQKVNISINVSA
jgi:Protein of unknown function (DUF3383)